MGLLSKLYGYLSYVSFCIFVQSPHIVFYYLSKDKEYEEYNVLLIFVYFLVLFSLPGLTELLKNKTDTEFEEVFIKNSMIGFSIGCIVILSGFFSTDPSSTRFLLGTLLSWLVFIFKYK